MASVERWYYLQIIEHVENDGADYVRHGPEELDTPHSLRSVKERITETGASSPKMIEALREARDEIDEILFLAKGWRPKDG